MSPDQDPSTLPHSDPSAGFGELSPHILPAVSHNDEIERRFHSRPLADLPFDLPGTCRVDLHQVYTFDADGSYTRFRKTASDDRISFEKTTKTGLGLVRRETTEPITSGEFQQAVEACGDHSIRKTRYVLFGDGFPTAQGIDGTGMVSAYLDQFEHGLWVFEVEFCSVEDSLRFRRPEWLLQEITDERELSNASLALMTLERRGELTRELQSLSEMRPKNDRAVSYITAVDGSAAILTRMSVERDRPIVIAVSGASASGKTSMGSRKLQERLGGPAHAIIVNCDGFNRGEAWRHQENESREEQGLPLFNWESPELYAPDEIRALAAGIRDGTVESFEAPEFSFVTGEREPHGARHDVPRFVIFEGLYATKELQGVADYSIHFTAPRAAMFLRRIERDLVRAGFNRGFSAGYIASAVIPAEAKWVDPQSDVADVVAWNPMNPHLEGASLGIADYSRKYDRALQADALLSCGFSEDGTRRIMDAYISVPGLPSTEHSYLRVRRGIGEESVTLTYRGRDRDGLAVAWKSETKLPDETFQVLQEAFSPEDRIGVSMLRTSYSHPTGVRVRISDEVTVSGNGRSVPCGTITEIVAPSDRAFMEFITTHGKRLGITPEDGRVITMVSLAEERIQAVG